MIAAHGQAAQWPESGQGQLWPISDQSVFGDADGSGVRVCILDTGVDEQHPMVGTLEVSVGIEAGEDQEPAVRPMTSADEVGHGTACAGIIRALAPRCSMASVKVLTAGKNGTGKSLLAGLRWAMSEGYDVINLSLSSSKPWVRDELAALCDDAYFGGSILCAAMHNFGVSSYPWRFASVVSVASIPRRANAEPFPGHQRNPAPPAEFLAPGVGVSVAWTSGSIIKATGNSFATPYVSGLVALMLSKYPDLTPYQVKTVLHLTSASQGVGGARQHSE